MDGALPEELAERFRQIREEQERQLDQEAAAARERKLETQRRRQLNERLEESKRRRVHCQLAKVNVRAASARPHTAASQGPLRPGGRRPSCSPDAGVPYSRDDHLMGWDFDGMMEAVGACDGALRGRGSKQLTDLEAWVAPVFASNASSAPPRDGTVGTISPAAPPPPSTPPPPPPPPSPPTTRHRSRQWHAHEMPPASRAPS